MSPAEAIVAIAVGVVAGMYAGLLGVGGGIVMVPAMVLLLDQPQRVAEGTSLLAIVATAISAVRAHRRTGLVRPRWAQLLGIGGAVGAVAGSLVALNVISDEQLLRRIFGVFLLLVAAWVAARPPRRRPSEEA
jgi:uncharacterized membrane protein YfcA